MKEIACDAVVIGAGPAGYVCAIRLAQYRKKVVCVEQEELGGTCLNWGCIPSKALIAAGHFVESTKHAAAMGFTVEQPKLDLSKLVEWKDGIVKRLTGGIGMLFKKRKIELVKGTAKLAAPNRVEIQTADGPVLVSARDVVLATGSEPAPIPGFDFGPKVWSSTEALSPKELPKKMLIIGGGVIGMELGMFYAQVGTEVTVVEFMDQILPGVDPALVKVVARKAKKAGIKIHTKSAAKSWKDKGEGVEDDDDTKSGQKGANKQKDNSPPGSFKQHEEGYDENALAGTAPLSFEQGPCDQNLPEILVTKCAGSRMIGPPGPT